MAELCFLKLMGMGSNLNVFIQFFLMRFYSKLELSDMICFLSFLTFEVKMIQDTNDINLCSTFTLKMYSNHQKEPQ